MSFELLQLNDVNADVLTVNEYWNILESVLINTIDSIAPISVFSSNPKTRNSELPLTIKAKVSKRKRLLKLNKINNCSLRLAEIKSLNVEINKFFQTKRALKVKQAALGPKINIWKAVKIAKNVCHVDMPQIITVGGRPVHPDRIADAFASHFDDKVKNYSTKATLNDNVYNGKYCLKPVLYYSKKKCCN